MKNFIKFVIIVLICYWVYKKCSSDSTNEKAKVEQTTKSSKKKATKGKKNKKNKNASSSNELNHNESSAEAQPTTKKQATPEDVVEEAKSGQASDDVIF